VTGAELRSRARRRLKAVHDLRPDTEYGRERRAFVAFVEKRRRSLMLRVPAGSPELFCPRCGAAYFSVITASGKLAMVSCDVEFGERPTDVKDGLGKSHVALCAERGV
jgi:hypothetical protein